MAMDAPALTAPRQDAWLWRLIATGCSFVLFGLGGLTLRVLIFPLQRLLPGDHAARQRRARAAIMRAFHLHIRFMVKTGVLTLDFQGIERLGQAGQLIIANHPSLLDVVLLAGHIRDANCIVKHSLAENPFMRGPIRRAGYLTNNASLDMLDQAAAVLRQGETLIVFPEGTRTPLGEPPRFHRGACAIALRGARIVTPVVIGMSPRSLSKGEPWYRIPYRRMRYTVRVGEDIDPSQWLAHDLPPAAGRKMNDFLHHYFESRLAQDEYAGS